MRLSAEMARSIGVGGLWIPFEYAEFIVAALNDEPMDWTAGNAPADFATVLLESRHAKHLVWKVCTRLRIMLAVHSSPMTVFNML